MLHARAVHYVARGEVVGAVEDDIALRGERVELVRFDARRDWHYLDIGIRGAQRASGGEGFLRPDGVGAVEDLALQVGEVDFVGVRDGQARDAGGSEIERRRAAEAAGTDDENSGGTQPLLPLDADLVEEDVPGIPEKLLVVYRTRRSR